MTTSHSWHLISGEYPPDPGGVADYTAALARGLVATGAEVQVWTSGTAAGSVVGCSGEIVHRVAERFGLSGLRRVDRTLRSLDGPRTILVQYVPHAFGWRSMNVPLIAWIAWRAGRGDDIRILFHEVAFPWVRHPLRYNLLAVVHRMMAAVLIHACARVYVSTSSWMPLLGRLGRGKIPLVWTPVPSNIPVAVDADAIARRRSGLTAGDPSAKVIGHFGTYGPATARDLSPALLAILQSRPDVRVLLLGAGGNGWKHKLLAGRDGWLTRVVAPGPLPAEEVAESLRACDLVLQPYPDGASGRRTTLMAALANGVPAITTISPRSESVWSNGAVGVVPVDTPGRLARMALDLLDQPDRLAELGQAGRQLYEARFAVRHTVEILLELQ